MSNSDFTLNPTAVYNLSRSYIHFTRSIPNNYVVHNGSLLYVGPVEEQKADAESSDESSDESDDSPPCCEKCNKEEDLDNDLLVCDECSACYCSTCEYKNGISVFALSCDDEIICYKCKIKKHIQTSCKLSIYHLELIKRIAAE